MELRLVELFLCADQKEAVQAMVEEGLGMEAWHEPISDGRLLVRVLASSGSVEAIMDRLESSFGETEGFRIIVYPVAASVPILREEGRKEGEASAADDDDSAEANEEPGEFERRHRISRAELHGSLSAGVEISYVFVLMSALSAIVAALGIIGDNVAIVIGAMVIAPLLGPNVALSMATTLADAELAGRAIRANILGAAVALAIAIGIGFFVTLDPTVNEIASRTRVGLPDLGLALAAGSAGALAFTSGVSATLIGVMVAVALLPPLVVFGLLLGAGFPALAMSALLLAVTNVICVNLAGVGTFLAQGIRPLDWWEAERARRASIVALVIWIGLLGALVFVITISGGGWGSLQQVVPAP
ncbi:MAG: TIGR00341 family protein [Gemmatimonadota bacterium]